MTSTVHTPICIQHDLPISESVWEKTFTMPEKGLGQCGNGASQRVDMQELSSGLFLLHSEMIFNRGTELREEYPESGVFQLSFCLNGCMEWDFEATKGGHYEISPTVGVFPSAPATISRERHTVPLALSWKETGLRN